MLAVAGFLFATQTTAVDPLNLAIGLPGSIEIRPGSFVNLRSGRQTTPKDIAVAARQTRFVYLGESHDNLEHHHQQAAVIEALVADGRDVVVGFEMFTRPVQRSLGGWTLGKWSEAEFIEYSQWKTQWGFDFGLYRPIFESVRKHALPMLALNVPRDWVRAVGRGGYGALSNEQRAQLPAQMTLGNEDHKAVFNALIGGHPMNGPQADNMYAAQVLWDEAMADTAISYLGSRRSDRLVIAIVAGSGHVMYGQGINWRVLNRTGDAGISVVMAEASGSGKVARGLADFVYLSKP